MKTIGHFKFPENPDEAKTWQPDHEFCGFGGQNHGRGTILAAATTRIEGRWKAYIGVVDGHNFDVEYQEVLEIGTPLLESMAREIFDRYDGLPYAR